MIVGAAIGNAVEWFDFAIYGFLATFIAANFFPAGNDTAALLNTFAIFAAVSIWLFHLANSRPGADPLAHVFESISDGTDWVIAHIRKYLPRRREVAK